MTNKTTPIKALKAACLFAIAALAAAPAFASYDPQAKLANEAFDNRYAIAQSSVPGVGNETDALKLYYTGTSTGATVTINSTGALFYKPGAVLDTTFPAGALTAALYPTIGQFCDAVNASGGVYLCRMEDARRSDPFGYLAAVTAVEGSYSLKAIGGLPIGFSPGQNTAFSVYGSTWISLGINPPADNRIILKKCTFYGAGTSYVTFSVSGVKRVVEGAPDGVIRNDSSIVWTSSAATATATTISFDDSGYGGLSFAASYPGIPGPSSGLPSSQSTVQPSPPNLAGRVVVRLASDGLSQNSADYLYCQWAYRPVN